jgi:protein Tex
MACVANMTDNNAFDCFDLDNTIRSIAAVLSVHDGQVRAAVELLDAGNTLPFIARYRKEATQGLDEHALRFIEDALAKARELAQRKTTILRTIEEQGQLTVELRRRIEACQDKKDLEDLYLPFKPKRRTRATIARNEACSRWPICSCGKSRSAGPRAMSCGLSYRPRRMFRTKPPPCKARATSWPSIGRRTPNRGAGWSNKRPNRVGSSLRSAAARTTPAASSRCTSTIGTAQASAVAPAAGHETRRSGRRAARRPGTGRRFDVLRTLRQQWITNPRFEFHNELVQTAEDCYRRLLLPATESAALQQAKERADEEAIAVFAKNLRELLLAAPAGPYVTIGIDPGFRTGCKVAVVDGTGKFLAHATLYPTPPHNDLEGAGRKLRELIARFEAGRIAIGNGTASRETDAFVTDVLRNNGLEITKVVVSESGASIYSASEIAAAEYPDLDVTVRGAISIAHRLQDPLAELVKLDPKSIGVGQYQHDVDQTRLRQCLDREVDSCVNAVGVDVNMASAPLLSHVAGIGPKLAQRIVEYRDAHGRFERREQLLKVPKLGPKAYEQAAGFLRIRDGQQPLDNSAVHPESYYVVERMAACLNVPAKQLVGNASLAAALNAPDFVDDRVGLPTVHDILAELAKPGRDPRSEFHAVQFTDGVRELADVREGMILEGVVTNVTRFGAFVDIGVHQDGLIHISQLANAYVQDPSEIVSVGDVVRVKVLEVDQDRRRIALSRKQASSG